MNIADFLPIAFPALFVGMWCVISLMLARLGGWHALAQAHRAASKPVGKRFGMESGSIGLVSYNGCLTVCVTGEGVYMSVWPMFRLGHPPLFFPWSEIHNPKKYLTEIQVLVELEEG